MKANYKTAKRALLHFPHAKLTAPALPVPSELFASTRLRDTVAKLTETAEAMFMVSISAQKLGIPWRLVLINNAAQRKAFTALVNPKVVHADTVCHGMWENCISLGATYVWTRRPRRITVEFVDADGVPQRADLSALSARAFLHELDHLDGKCLLTAAPSRDFAVTSNALMQRHTWRKDFPSAAAYATPLFHYFDESSGRVLPVPELSEEANEMNRQMPCEEYLPA